MVNEEYGNGKELVMRGDMVYEVFRANGVRVGVYGMGFRILAIKCALRLGIGAFVRQAVEGDEWYFRRIGTVASKGVFMERKGY